MKRTDIRRILIIGAGPIVIGQACEFDYSGSQACRALREEGYEVILANSNPATIMTDPNLADRTYIEPLTEGAITAIIQAERPDALLPTMGGQTALNIARNLSEKGALAQYGVELIGANFDAIERAEDREAFKVIVERSGLESLYSETVTTLAEAHAAAKKLGYPMIVRPAFTLGGSGGSIVYTPEQFDEQVQHGLDLSPISQVLLEESALGWKEYEFEVMRDCRDNVVIVCSVENVDPMGVHTGDSITVAPAQTLSDKEYHILRNASLSIIREVGVEAGGCNIQFAVHPKTGRFVVIEMNPRVSRSSALVSKATGVPIAKIAAKLAVGMTLDEIDNDITKTTPACFEPAIDYVVTKIPRFSFDKFPGADAQLSPQMKSVGEVMAIGATFQESFQKALRGLETGLLGFYFPKQQCDEASLLTKLQALSSERLRWVYQALYQGMTHEKIADVTGLDPWFLHNWDELIALEKQIAQYALADMPEPLMLQAKHKGFSDAQIAAIIAEAHPGLATEASVRTVREASGVFPVYKAVDTCAGEFEAYTPYYYGTYDGQENEAPNEGGEHARKVVIIGGGPNRIGQGIEFDYCCVHAAFALKDLGMTSIMVNSNPETVSTDYDISDRLYFEPLTVEDVLNILAQERPDGVITQLGGQTPLKLAQAIHDAGYKILGTSVDSIDAAEDRERFKAILAQCQLDAPESGIAYSKAQAIAEAQRIGYPLIARPSYVLGGQAMRVFYNETALEAYLDTVVDAAPGRPVLIDRFLESALELDVDAVSDGKDLYMGAILEHIEHAGVHSGDSVCVFPAQSLSPEMTARITRATHELAKALQVKGLLNIQFAIKDDVLYVLEVNPRASRTVPFVCKSTGDNLIQLAVRVMLGETLAQIAPPARPPLSHVTVKAPVFPFVKFKGTDPKLGPEMRSTGEVMGLDKTVSMAYAKAQLGAGMKLPKSGAVFISLNDTDKLAALPLAKQLTTLGFTLVATTGTAAFLQEQGFAVTAIGKKHEGGPNAEQWIAEGKIQLVLNTPIGQEALIDDSYIRKAAVLHAVPMMTTLPGAKAFVDALASLHHSTLTVNALQSVLPIARPLSGALS